MISKHIQIMRVYDRDFNKLPSYIDVKTHSQIIYYMNSSSYWAIYNRIFYYFSNEITKSRT